MKRQVSHFTRTGHSHGRAPGNFFRGLLWTWFYFCLGGAFECSAAPVSFTREIAPLLQAKCNQCHGAEKSKGNYRLDTFDRLSTPGASGHLPIPSGRPNESELLRLCRAADPDDRMPQDAEPLPPGELDLLERWIVEGATFDGADRGTSLAEFAGPIVYPAAPVTYPRPMPVAALVFAPDGSELAVGGFHEVTVWTPTNGLLRRRLGQLPQRIYALAWHPTQPWLAVAGGEPGRSGEVRLVHIESADTVRRLAVAADVFLAAAFSPDGTRMVAGGADSSVSVFNVMTGRRERRLAVCADWVTALAWSPDGKRFAVASRDRTARVCDADTGEGITTFTAHSAAVNALAFSADGEKIFSGGRDRTVLQWNSRDAETKETVAATEGEVLALIPAFEGVLSVGTEGRVRYQPFKDPKHITSYDGSGGRLNALAANETNRYFVAAGQDGWIHVWEMGKTNQIATWRAVPGGGGR